MLDIEKARVEIEARNRVREEAQLCNRFTRIVVLLVVGIVLLFKPTSVDAAEYAEAKTIALQSLFHTKTDWHVTAYAAPGDPPDTNLPPVKICFWNDPNKKQNQCETITSASPHSNIISSHQMLEDLSVVTLIQASNPLLAVRSVARFTAGGSGSLDDMSLWSYNKETDYFDALISLPINEISEYKIISSGPLAGSIVMANGLWQMDEGHFGDHRFWIQVYKYSKYYQTFHSLIGFTTVKKYSSEKMGVIDQELGTIQKLLNDAYQGNNPLD